MLTQYTPNDYVHYPALLCSTLVKTLRSRQNGRHFSDDIFQCIFLNENVSISIEISLTVLPKDPINTIPALVQIKAWRRPGRHQAIIWTSDG